MKRYPKLTPQLDHVVRDQRRLLSGDGAAAERATAEHVTRFEAEIRW